MVYGAFESKITDPSLVEFSHLTNNWSFHSLLLKDNLIFFAWLRRQGLLASPLNYKCPKCIQEGHSGTVSVSKNSLKLRCKEKNHGNSYKVNSFFENCQHDIHDLMLYIRCLLNGMPMYRSCMCTEVSYGSVSCKWASRMRSIMKNYFVNTIQNTKLSGIIEIDESLLGRKQKHFRGLNLGMHVWIFGLLERRETKGRLILYPVERRDAATLIPIILKHVEQGSTIYSDAWGAYNDLNDLGFRHFTVVNKYHFKKEYKSPEGKNRFVCKIFHPKISKNIHNIL